jgi:hypothetical protein
MHGSMRPMNSPDDNSSKRIAERNRFLAACSLAGAATTAFRSPRNNSDDDIFWVDIARLGSPDAPNVLVLSCGLNGDEGYCGSTILTEWLSRGRQRDVPRNTGLIMVHAILPPAYAAGSAPAPENTGSQRWSDSVLSAAARRFASYAEKTGLRAANDIPLETAPKPETAWLRDASDSIVDEIIEHAQRIALLEFHTSLRPQGNVAITSCHAPGSEATQHIKAWFGDDAETNDPAVLDLFALGFGDRLGDLPFTAVHVEFGVYTMQGLLQLEARRTATERHADMRALFSPQSDVCSEHVASEGTHLVTRALQGLAAI